jgi:hypothetical protein
LKLPRAALVIKTGMPALGGVRSEVVSTCAGVQLQGPAPRDILARGAHLANETAQFRLGLALVKQRKRRQRKPERLVTDLSRLLPVHDHDIARSLGPEEGVGRLAIAGQLRGVAWRVPAVHERLKDLRAGAGLGLRLGGGRKDGKGQQPGGHSHACIPGCTPKISLALSESKQLDARP